MRRIVLAMVVAAAATAAAWSVFARRARQTEAPAGLVIITIDTWRADRLDGRVTPALWRLTASGRRFTRARTTAPLTLPAHASLMTGLLPPEHGARDNGMAPGAGHPTIATVLREAGFRTGAFVSAFVLDRQFGLANGFDVYDDGVPRNPDATLRLEAERRGAQTVDAALAWMNQAGRSDRFFLWLHLFEPHAPYPAGYDADVSEADRQAARLIAAIESREDAASIAIVIAGDHGEALGDHGEQTHGMLLYDATLRVPLMLRGPGVAASVEDAPVSLVDVAPTALRWMGLTPPAAMRGADLRGAVSADRDHYSETIYPRAAGWHELSALSGRRWKAIRSSETELYEIDTDPGEARDVSSAHRQTADAMGAAAASIGAAARAKAAAPSAEAQQRLRALGYVGGGAAAAPGGAPNPAREIASWVTFERAMTLVGAGRAREALGDLTALAAKYPRARVFRSMHARALQETGDHAGSLRAHRALVADWPGDAMLFQDLAAAARLAGDAAEAARAGEAALALEPGNAAALNGLGLVHADAGRAAEAAFAFERAASRDPGNASYWTNLGNARRALGDAAGALAAYQRALERAPDHPDALNGQGVLLVQARRAADAVPLFERALARDPAHIEARLNLGIAFQESGRPADAAAAYRAVLARARPGSREHDAAKTLLGDRDRR